MLPKVRFDNSLLQWESKRKEITKHYHGEGNYNTYVRPFVCENRLISRVRANLLNTRPAPFADNVSFRMYSLMKSCNLQGIRLHEINIYSMKFIHVATIDTMKNVNVTTTNGFSAKNESYFPEQTTRELNLRTFTPIKIYTANARLLKFKDRSNANENLYEPRRYDGFATVNDTRFLSFYIPSDEGRVRWKNLARKIAIRKFGSNCKRDRQESNYLLIRRLSEASIDGSWPVSVRLCNFKRGSKCRRITRQIRGD